MTETTAVVKKESFVALLEGKIPSFADVASKELDPKRLVKMALLAASRQPKIYECTPESVLQAMMDASATGIEPGGPLGLAHLIPRWNGKTKKTELQFQIDYKGLIELARRSGNVSDIEAHCVYENDTFVDERGLEPRLLHIPDRTGDRGKLYAVFAIAHIVGGKPHVEVLYKEDVDKVKRASTSRDKKGNLIGPWRDNEEEMWRKSAIRKMSKFIPKSVEFAEAVAIDNRGYVSTVPVPDARPAIAEPVAVGEIPASEDAHVVEEEPPPVEEEPPPEEEEPPPEEEAHVPPSPFVGLVDQVHVSTGEKEDGKKWKRFTAECGQWFFGTFSKTIGGKLQDAVELDSRVQIEWKQNGEYFNITKMTVEKDGE